MTSNPSQSLPYLDRACRGGHTSSCFNLIELHTSGADGGGTGPVLPDVTMAKTYTDIAVRQMRSSGIKQPSLPF